MLFPRQIMAKIIHILNYPMFTNGKKREIHLRSKLAQPKNNPWDASWYCKNGKHDDRRLKALLFFFINFL